MDLMTRNDATRPADTPKALMASTSIRRCSRMPQATPLESSTNLGVKKSEGVPTIARVEMGAAVAWLAYKTRRPALFPRPMQARLFASRSAAQLGCAPAVRLSRAGRGTEVARQPLCAPPDRRGARRGRSGCRVSECQILAWGDTTQMSEPVRETGN